MALPFSALSRGSAFRFPPLSNSVAKILNTTNACSINSNDQESSVKSATSTRGDVPERERQRSSLTLREALRKGKIECSRDPDHSNGPVSQFMRLTGKANQSNEGGKSFTPPKDAEADKDPKTLCDSSVYSFDMSPGSPNGSPASKEILDPPKTDVIVDKAGTVGSSANSALSPIRHSGEPQLGEEATQRRKPSNDSVNDYSASEYSSHSSPRSSIHTTPTSLSSNSATADGTLPPGWTPSGFQSPFFDSSFLCLEGCDGECSSPLTLETRLLSKSTQQPASDGDTDDLPTLQPTVYSGYPTKI